MALSVFFYRSMVWLFLRNQEVHHVSQRVRWNRMELSWITSMLLRLRCGCSEPEARFVGLQVGKFCPQRLRKGAQTVMEELVILSSIV